MADLDDLREGSRFGVGVPVAKQSFHVKGSDHLSWG
ncbi:MAG: 3-hydroxy-5-phosphonooxypentane-2,4-dione thiolase LsrF, partial [Rikenellaceae bacterium]